MHDLFYPDSITYLIVKLCVLLLAVLVWYLATGAPVV
uniref:Uncharacterized protein n=1 Tax=Gloeothece verrucosa (strain PCC 7822) TaxID=497965 RepID=E0UJD4_GLOV7|nr:hypothetical protein Cyan7822_5065 [Gloeothece verrucosa PCC 7822]